MEEWARPAVRLHPVQGTPAVSESHIGGPLLWPAGEPWPWCDGSSHDEGLVEYPMGDEQPVGVGDWPPVANGSKVGGWAFGREGALNVFACPRDLRHPIKLHVD
jgi:hypothetical protein